MRYVAKSLYLAKLMGWKIVSSEPPYTHLITKFGVRVKPVYKVRIDNVLVRLEPYSTTNYGLAQYALIINKYISVVGRFNERGSLYTGNGLCQSGLLDEILHMELGKEKYNEL